MDNTFNKVTSENQVKIESQPETGKILENIKQHGRWAIILRVLWVTSLLCMMIEIIASIFAWSNRPVAEMSAASPIFSVLLIVIGIFIYLKRIITEISKSTEGDKQQISKYIKLLKNKQ